MASTLKIEFKNTKPVDIADFTTTLTAIGNLYSSFAIKHGKTGEQAKARLVVEKVQEGSIVFFVQQAMIDMLPLFDGFNILVEFAKNIDAIKDWFLYRKGREPEMTINDFRDMRDMNSLVSNDNGSTMSISVLDDNRMVVYEGCTFNFSDGNQMREQMATQIVAKREPTTENVHRNQVMKVYQHRIDAKSETGNKAIIDAIFPGKHMNLMFASPELKSMILFSKDNPANRLFLVDVIVKTVEGKPVGYLVTSLNDSFDIEDE